MNEPYEPTILPKKFWLSLNEAQKLALCRLCRLPMGKCDREHSFVFNYGKEHAHRWCLNQTDVAELADAPD